MPTRFIKESCRTSKNLHAVADFSERLFWRLLTTADDYGRCLACPAIVKSHCFPLQEGMSNQKIEKALKDLAKHGLLVLYQDNDREYAEIVTFSKHQGPPRAKQSKYPSASSCMHMLASADESASPPNTNTDLIPSSSSPDLKSKTHSKNGRAREICDDDRPTDKHRELAKVLKVDLGPEWGKFKNYCLAHGKRYVNFEAAFRNWLANAPTMNGGRS